MTTATVSPTQPKSWASGSVVEREKADYAMANRLMFRAPDEAKFKDFASLRAHASSQRARSREVEVDMSKFLFAHKDGRDYCYLDDYNLRLTNLFYKQVALEAGIKLETLSLLKPGTRINVLNELWEPHRLGRVDAQGNAISSVRNLLLETNEAGEFDVRSMNGARYERLWDEEVFAEVERWLTPSGWVPAYPTFNVDPATPVSDRPKALIRTDRYSFTFFFTEPKFKAGEGFSNQKADGMTGSADIAKAQGFADTRDTDGLGGLRKGLMVYNGETGHKSFGWQMFLFRNVCSNFNIWDLQEGRTKRVRHTASVRDAFEVFKEDVKNLSGALSDREYDFLAKAAKTEFAKDDEAAIKRLNRLGVTLANARLGVESAKLEVNGANLSVWSVVNGLTWHAKELDNEDDRVALSVQAGNVLNAAMAD
ncbi:MAG: hypothetical protein BroJett014_27770 [Planctomycetota bacterium]|nr:MAG: hypothetical protein BroJett014_27770 [Planctomycetota bacterium]